MMNDWSKPSSSGPGLISWFQSGPPSGPSPRCHFPTMPVRYPACLRRAGRVVVAGGIERGASPGAMLEPGRWRHE